MNYPAQLDGLYEAEKKMDNCPPETRLEFLGGVVFGFTTYDGEVDALFAGKMLEVIEAILEKKTFQYIENRENYLNYLYMVNTPFLSKVLEWGTSIRGAWFWEGMAEGPYRLESELGETPPLTVKPSQVCEFMRALLDWSKGEG